MTDRNKNLVRSFHEGCKRGDLRELGADLHPDFRYGAPRYLPWGGETRGAVAFVTVVVPRIARVLDLGRLTCDCLVAEDDRVVATIDVGVVGSDATVRISEHWTLDAGKALSRWVAYFEPAALLSGIERHGEPASWLDNIEISAFVDPHKRSTS